jgi:hypothetical protein
MKILPTFWMEQELRKQTYKHKTDGKEGKDNSKIICPQSTGQNWPAKRASGSPWGRRRLLQTWHEGRDLAPEVHPDPVHALLYNPPDAWASPVNRYHTSDFGYCSLTIRGARICGPVLQLHDKMQLEPMPMQEKGGIVQQQVPQQSHMP